MNCMLHVLFGNAPGLWLDGRGVVPLDMTRMTSIFGMHMIPIYPCEEAVRSKSTRLSLSRFPYLLRVYPFPCLFRVYPGKKHVHVITNMPAASSYHTNFLKPIIPANVLSVSCLQHRRPLPTFSPFSMPPYLIIPNKQE
jgi:hypothetical protein